MMLNVIDLQDSSIFEYWKEADEDVSLIIGNMEERENWTLDNEEKLKHAIIEWAANLTEEKLINIVEKRPDALIRIFAFMKSKRALYLIRSIEVRSPGIISDLLLDSLDNLESKSQDTRSSLVLRDRLVALYRVDLLERIFSKERSEKIKEAIKVTSEASGGIYG